MIENSKQKNSYSDCTSAQNGIIELFTRIYSHTGKDIMATYGEENYELLKEIFLSSMLEMWKKQFAKIKDRSLNSYIKWLLSIVTSDTEYEVVEKTNTSVRLKFVKCPWAKYFREIGEPSLGKFFCDADFPMVKEFNDKIIFERDKTLMDGDSCCNHHFYIKEKD